MQESVIKALEKADLLGYFEELAPSHQKKSLKWINEAKKTEMKDRRIVKMIEMLKQK
jgi:uncharacterized protein YdeI (YjbR/CyaY-like superfamily)